MTAAPMSPVAAAHRAELDALVPSIVQEEPMPGRDLDPLVAQRLATEAAIDGVHLGADDPDDTVTAWRIEYNEPGATYWSGWTGYATARSARAAEVILDELRQATADRPGGAWLWRAVRVTTTYTEEPW